MKRIILSLLLAGLLSLPSMAQLGGFNPSSSYTPNQARDAVKNGEAKSLSEIKSIVKSRYGGYMVAMKRFDGQRYSLRWEKRGGIVVDLEVDARTGRILSERGAR